MAHLSTYGPKKARDLRRLLRDPNRGFHSGDEIRGTDHQENRI